MHQPVGDPVDPVTLAGLMGAMAWIGEDEPQREGLEHRDLGCHGRRDDQIRLIAADTTLLGLSTGHADRGGRETADQFAGEPLESDRASQCPVVLPHLVHDVHPPQPGCRLDQHVLFEAGEFT